MTLYATDLDGTLLRSDMTISDDCARKLNMLMSDGVLFTYATARSFNTAAPLLKKLKLNTPAVCFNGVFIVDPVTGEHIHENRLSAEELEAACDFFIENSLAPLVYANIGGRERVSYLENRLEDVIGYVEPRRSDLRLRAVKSYSELFSGEVYYFTLFNPKMNIERLDAFFCRENGYMTNLQPDTYDKSIMWYEIFSASAGKAAAVAWLRDYLGANRLVCFGDNTNDLSMLLTADRGIAVGNANDILKANADEVIGTNDENSVAEYIFAAERSEKPLPKAVPEDREQRFSAALSAATMRVRGIHGSVGTLNEKLIHAVLKNYYVPEENGQEVKIGAFFADAVNEDGIYEIQTRSLFKLKEKLKVFTSAAHVCVVHPVTEETRTVYINSDTGEIAKETAFRKHKSMLRFFEELYSIKDFLKSENLTVVLVGLKTEKRIYFSGEEIPDLRKRSVRKNTIAEVVPLGITRETRLCSAEDYRQYLPEGLHGEFTKKELCAAAKEAVCSKRTEILKTVGVISHTGKRGREYLYSITEKEGAND